MGLTWKSDIDVELIQQIGSDEMIAHAAMVSVRGITTGSPLQEDKIAGLVNYLMKSRHGTPFEHGSLTIRVHAPIKVWREWHRHRIGWSYNEESGRYKQLEPVFYIPSRSRSMIRPDGFKSARPAFDVATEEEYAETVRILESGYSNAYYCYEKLLTLGVDRGLARDVLGVGIYSACYCTANPRSIMAFLELRTGQANGFNPVDESPVRPSKPLYEIEMAARKLEAIFASFWPVTYKAWQENGRAAP